MLEMKDIGAFSFGADELFMNVKLHISQKTMRIEMGFNGAWAEEFDKK